MLCVFASCSDGGSDNPVNPTPKPEEVKTEITIDSGIISNGLSFASSQGEQSISFSVNADWMLSVASTTSGATWCKASATNGGKGSANVKFTLDENTSYDDRSVSVTIKAGTVSKTFTITQKGADAMLVTTTKYEVAQEGGKIEVEVKANIDYQFTISETAKDWIAEAKSKSRGLTTYKHTFEIAMNEEVEKREGEITFNSGDKVETVKVYQAGGAIILLTQNEYTVSDAGETISVDIKSNVDFGVQMPDVDWITDEASSRGMSSHTLKYVVAANEGYDSRSAEIIFYDKNSDLKDTLKVVQAQKDAIIISKKEYDVKAEGETIEVKLSANVNIEVQIPSNAAWVAQTESRALTEKSIILKVAENISEENRSAEIIFKDKNSDLSEKVTITQKCPTPAGYVDGVLSIKTAGTMKKLLGDDYMNITSLKIVGPINGDDIYYLRKMSGGYDFSEIDRGKLNTLDLSEASIVKGGDWYHKAGLSYTGTDTHYTSDNIIGQSMFRRCYNLQKIILPRNIISIEAFAFEGCVLTSITIPEGVTSIGLAAFEDCELLTAISIPSSVTSVSHQAFDGCRSLVDVYIKDVAAWCSIDFDTHSWNNPLHYGANMYLNNELVTELVIPEGVKAINNLAFYRLESITKIVMPNTLESIGEEAFYGCKNLKSLEIPNNVTSIGELAFCACDSLESLTIGDGIELIPRSAFSGFDLLSKLVIGKGVKKIDVQAFSGTITQCYSYATTPPTLLTEKAYNPYFGDFYIDAFYYSSFKDAILYVPARCGSAYKTSRWGKYFTNIVEMD